jgi:hypothetical protein
MNLTIEQRVDNGWNWLEETAEPGWQDKITVRFNIRNGCDCICGLVFEEEASDSGVNGYTFFLLNFGKDPETYGFSAYGGEKIEMEYVALQAEWLRRISQWRTERELADRDSGVWMVCGDRKAVAAEVGPAAIV